MNIKINIISFIIFCFTFVWIFNFAIRGIDTFHDGVVFSPALDVSNGKVLFRETFTQYGLLTTYIHTLFIEILGKQLISIKIATVFFYSAIAVMLWITTRKLLSDKLAIFIILAWIALAPYYSGPFYSWAPVYSAFFLLVVLYILVSEYKSLSSKHIFLMGIFSALAFWSKQSYFILFLSIISLLTFFRIINIYTNKKLFEHLFYLTLSFTLISSLFFISIFSTNSMQDFWLQSIRTAYTIGRILASIFTFESLISNFLKYPVVLFYPIAIIYFFRNGIDLKFRKNNINKSILYIGISFISAASLIGIYPVPDSQHIYWAITPIIGIGPFFLYEVYKYSSYKWLVKIISLLFVVSILLLGTFNLKSAYIKTASYVFKSEYRGISNGLLLTNTQQAFLNDYEHVLDNYFSNNPNKKLLLLYSDSILLTFSDRDLRIGPFLYNYSGFTAGIYPEYMDEITRLIKISKPLIIYQRKYANSIKNYKVLKSYPFEDIVILVPIN